VTVVFVEGRPQRLHRLLVALGSGTLGLGSVVVSSLVEQIPRRSRNGPNISDA
jgi:hypothetical protein